MDQHQRWTNLTFLGLAAATAAILGSGLDRVVQRFDLEARFRDIDWGVRGFSFLVALGVYFGLSRYSVANQFVREVFEELEKVTWPSQKDTSASTVVVLITVVVAGAVLGGMDTLWVWVFRGLF